MSFIRKVLLCIYAFITAILGIFFVPCNLSYGYGIETGIISVEFVPIWKLIDKSKIIGGNFSRYEINVTRALYMFAILTVIVVILYFVVGRSEHNSVKNK